MLKETAQEECKNKSTHVGRMGLWASGLGATNTETTHSLQASRPHNDNKENTPHTTRTKPQDKQRRSLDKSAHKRLCNAADEGHNYIQSPLTRPTTQQTCAHLHNYIGKHRSPSLGPTRTSWKNTCSIRNPELRTGACNPNVVICCFC